MSQIYIVVSDKALCAAIAEALQLASFDPVQETADIAQALKSENVAAIILDEANADKKMLKAFQAVTDVGKNKRIFFLGTPDASWNDNSQLEYFPKPLRLGYLLTRIAFHVRTRLRLQNTIILLGAWRFELHNRQIIRQEDDTVIRLTEKETALLDYLAQSDGAVSREELLAAIWGHDERIDTHTLETHIYQLRRKLDPEGKGTEIIVNEQGAYQLNLA